MKSFLFLFGRSPELSLAELERLCEIGLLKASIEVRLPDGALLKADEIDDAILRRLGGTIRVVELGISPEAFLPSEHRGKFPFGFSFYHRRDWRERRRTETTKIRMELERRGIHSRFLESRSAELPTASVRGNRLLQKGAEFVIYAQANEELYGRTLFIHNIDAYTSRDRARPARDPKIGMLPPKLAQIMLNLAVSKETRLIWDPMAGTGVVLQEALLAGYSVCGSDSSTQMVAAMEENMEWIRSRFSHLPHVEIFKHDIRDGWPKGLRDVDGIVSEGYLGRPISRPADEAHIRRTEDELRQLYTGFFREAHKSLRPNSRVVICLPFFRDKGVTKRMGFVDDLVSDTYNLRGTYDYAPHDQLVGRQILIFEKA